MTSKAHLLARENLRAVHEVAHNVRRTVGPRADFDDLVGDGMVGLLRAAETAPDDCRDFVGWAKTHIRRSMIDGLRAAWGREFRPTDDSLERPVGDATRLADLIPDPRVDLEMIVENRERLVELVLAPAQTRKTRLARLGGKELTTAEVEVLAGAAAGETSKITAARTGRAVETIKSYRRRIIAKLGAADMTNAVYLATSAGLIGRTAA